MKKYRKAAITILFYFCLFTAISVSLTLDIQANSTIQCESLLGHPNIDWIDVNENLEVSASHEDCPRDCKIIFKYKLRKVVTALYEFYDIMIIEYKLSPGCTTCDENYNFIRLILWGIWETHKQQWGLQPGTSQTNQRVSAPSCWKEEYAPHEITFLPCNSTCCIQLYSVARAPFLGVVYFWIGEPINVLDNCTTPPCNKFQCDDFNNIDLTLEEASDLTNRNPHLFQIEKSSIDLENYIKIYPNPATNQLNIEINKYEYDVLKIYLYDLLGNKLIDSALQNTSNSTLSEVDLTNISQGIYFIIIIYKGEIIYKNKIIIYKD